MIYKGLAEQWGQRYGFIIGTTAALLAAAGIAGAGGVASSALAGRAKTSTSNTQSSWNNTSTSNPTLDPIQQKIYELLTSKATARLNQSTPLGGYEATGLSNINKVSDSVRRTIENRLASNGISGPAAGASMTQLELARAGEATRFQNSLPLLSRELGIQDEGLAASAYALKPLGSTTTSTGSGTNVGTTTTSGNVAGGAASGVSSVGSILGYLAALGKLGSPSVTTPTSTTNPSGTLTPGTTGTVPTGGSTTTAGASIPSWLMQYFYPGAVNYAGGT